MPASRSGTLAGGVFIALLLAWMFWSGIVPKLRSLGADGVVISFEVRFDDAEFGSSINDRLRGDLSVPDLLQDAAACRNGPDWMSDATLDTEVVVSSRSDLIRAAELGSAGEFDWGLIQLIESSLWRGVNAGHVPSVLEEEGWDREVVFDYLRQRGESPSRKAQLRFVAYAAPVTQGTRGRLNVVDTSTLDASAINAYASRTVPALIYVAGQVDGPRQLPASSCRSVLVNLDGARE